MFSATCLIYERLCSDLQRIRPFWRRNRVY